MRRLDYSGRRFFVRARPCFFIRNMYNKIT